MRIFLDSSALAKRYIQEPGSPQVLARCAEASEILLSILCIPETVSAFNRLRREKALPPKTYEQLKEFLNNDINAATVIPIDHPVLRKTIECLEKTSARTLDALQIASAQEGRCELFLSADKRQCEAAERIGLKSEWV